MATQEDIDELMQLFHEFRPPQKEIQRGHPNADYEGMLGVLIYLDRANETVTAGMISKVMHITTGRVSVLIRKMSDKGLITRNISKSDGRVTEIHLTNQGRKVIADMQAQRRKQMIELIDTVGMERLKEFIRTSKQVWSILTPLSIDL